MALRDGDLVYLGETTALPLTLFRDLSELWLEVVVDGDERIEPRFRLATAPYAGSAQYCQDAVTLAGSAPGPRTDRSARPVHDPPARGAPVR